MNVFVVNSGSSSLKYALLDPGGDRAWCSGLVERIGDPDARLRHRWQSSDGQIREQQLAVGAPDHRAAFATIQDTMRTTGMDRHFEGVDAIGHRVVHGGEAFRAPVLVDDAVIEAIRRLIPLAPLHNPANLLGMALCRERFPGTPQVAVFDTAFHQSMPEHAWRYALPRSLYQDHGIRRYGFHGTSHAWVLRRTAEYLGRAPESLRLISLHLGNGASAAAIADGGSVDTSMGMTPLEGLVMGTRCGDIDPALPFQIGRAAGVDSRAVDELLNHESGLKGLCGSSDMRQVLQRADAGDANAALALDIYSYRVRKYIGAYLAVLGKVDAVVFTAGVGENAPVVRARICAGLEPLGIHLDPVRNESPRDAVAELQVEGAPLKLLRIRADEEREIAVQTRTVLTSRLA